MQRHACLFLRSLLKCLTHFLICGLLAVPAFPQNTVTLQGRVRSDNGRTLTSGVTGRLETSEGMLVGEQPANSNGDFEFANLRKMPYLLIVKAEGFQQLQKEMDLGQAGIVAFVDLFLSAAATEKHDASDVPALTDASAPKKARKEYNKGSRALASKNLTE